MIEPKSGRGLDILSTTPAMVVYAPGTFNMKGKGGLQYPKYGAVALEMVSQRQPGPGLRDAAHWHCGGLPGRALCCTCSDPVLGSSHQPAACP